MSGMSADREPGFLAGDNVWVLIPLAGISIPIVAIVGPSPVFLGLIGAVILVVAVALAARSLMELKHRHRLDELAAQERVSLAERDRFAAIDRLVEPEAWPAAVHRAGDEPASR